MHMKHILKILMAIVLMLSFSACFRKKSGAGNLQDWLEKHYPGRFEVLSTGADDAIRNLSFKVKKSLVAEKSNPLVQVLLKWDKRQPGLGLTTAAVDAAFAQAKTACEDARELVSMLKTHGFDNMAVGISNFTTMVLLFEESTAESRQERLQQLKTIFSAWPASGGYDKEILLMEPAEHVNLPGEVLPLSYFLEGNGQFRNHATYTLYLANDKAGGPKHFDGIWQYNTRNEHFATVSGQARSAMEAWAKTNVKQPFYLLETSEYEQIGEQPLRYRFKYPFTHKNPQEAAPEGAYIEPDGYFVVEFDLEKNEVVGVRVYRE